MRQRSSSSKVISAQTLVIQAALSLAMARDGSSGGIVRLATINKDGVERKMISGDQLPKTWDEL